MMERPRNTISREGRWQLARWTVLGTFGCLVISLAYNYLAFRNFSADALRQGLVSATVLPVILAGPLFFFLSLKLRELAIVNHRLGVVASTDSLTTCLNRGAFSAKVEANLINPSGRSMLPGGALLVIDADHFKSINDRFGHEEGDQALRLIAGSIRGCVRGTDLVGRLGGEEFGVFLHGASVENATEIAERIRLAVAGTEFLPGGWQHKLSVSVGGAVFAEPIGFSELFRVADKRLYEAKAAGRNRVRLSEVPPTLAAARASAALH